MSEKNRRDDAHVPSKHETRASPPDSARRNFIRDSFAVTATSILAPAGAMAAGQTATVKAAANGPNYLFLCVDEMRAPMHYESESLARFRTTYLPTQERLKANGIEFRRHYTASVACVPARATLFTGQYPSLHGVSSTDGAAKTVSDPGMFWLDPNTVPTMGDWFRAAGYRTYWKGKWHVSHSDILVPGTRTGLTSYNNDGTRNASKEDLYLKAGRLEEFGFTGWIGPEPHGSNPLNSGSSAKNALGRDQAIADQAIDLIRDLDRQSDASPWLMVVSLVNPHDIVLWGIASALSGNFDFSVDAEVPYDLFTGDFLRSFSETLDTKPSAQRSYRDGYKDYFQKIMNPNYLRFYYHLHKKVDAQLARVCDALRQSRFAANTLTVLTSDHGDLLGSHGGMSQKWHTAYEEALRVPLVISNPNFARRVIDIPTSHVDLLPTLLGLANVDVNTVGNQLAASHSEVRPLVGRDLTGMLTGTSAPPPADDPIYFMTDDEISRGSDQENFLGIPYAAVTQPNHVEAIVCRYNGKLWKYTRYFDNPQYWSTPGTVGDGAQDSILSELVPQQQIGEFVVPCKKTNKDTPRPEEFELYNLDSDPGELSNLYGSPAFAAQQAYMKSRLDEQRAQKRLTPQSGKVPGA